MSRFTVGQTYLFTTAVWTKDDTGQDKQHYLPLYRSLLKEVKVVALTCKSEHQVPIEYVEGRTGVGYIFVDPDGMEWHNQYPVASYGQITDVADRLVNPQDGQPASLGKKYHLMDDLMCQYLDMDTNLNAAGAHQLELMINWLDQHGYKFSYVGHDKVPELYQVKIIKST
jgi:hypothetical protein